MVTRRVRHPVHNASVDAPSPKQRKAQVSESRHCVRNTTLQDTATLMTLLSATGIDRHRKVG